MLYSQMWILNLWAFMTREEEETQNLEEQVFRTLSHQIRRDIIRFIGENKGGKFTEIKKSVRIEESAALSYHLNALGPLLLHDNGIYRLSEIGKDTYSLLTKLVTFSVSAEIIWVIKQQLGATVIANSLLWISALAFVIVVEGPLESITMLIFAALFSVSNIILYSILEHMKPGNSSWH